MKRAYDKPTLFKAQVRLQAVTATKPTGPETNGVGNGG